MELNTIALNLKTFFVILTKLQKTSKKQVYKNFFNAFNV